MGDRQAGRQGEIFAIDKLFVVKYFCELGEN